jgi:sec-independent protein translocase protein TatC
VGEDEFGAQMSLVEHLEELRSRIFKAGLAMVIAFAIGFLFRGLLFDVLIGPYCDLPDHLRGASGVFNAERCSLIVTNPLGAFFVTLKAAAVLAVAMLTLAGVVDASTLRRFRRHAIFAAFVLAAVITPTQDPFTMLVMGGPLVLFFEGNILFASLVERRRARAVPA